MLADTVRTTLYRDVIQTFSRDCFADKTVMDVGAGSGVLTFFACQSGARKVYAVEASAMATKMRLLIDRSLKTQRNLSWLAPDRIEVLNGAPVWDVTRADQQSEKIEQLTASECLPRHCVDTIISEPIGVLLVHERMLESYIHARDYYLKPGGHMLPSTGTIQLAPFSDSALWLETMQKARWWQQSDFYGFVLPVCDV
jgi:histone-arginine methyltransferase CARM1